MFGKLVEIKVIIVRSCPFHVQRKIFKYTENYSVKLHFQEFDYSDRYIDIDGRPEPWQYNNND